MDRTIPNGGVLDATILSVLAAGHPAADPPDGSFAMSNPLGLEHFGISTWFFVIFESQVIEQRRQVAA